MTAERRAPPPTLVLCRAPPNELTANDHPRCHHEHSITLFSVSRPGCRRPRCDRARLAGGTSILSRLLSRLSVRGRHPSSLVPFPRSFSLSDTRTLPRSSMTTSLVRRRRTGCSATSRPRSSGSPIISRDGPIALARRGRLRSSVDRHSPYSCVHSSFLPPSPNQAPGVVYRAACAVYGPTFRDRGLFSRPMLFTADPRALMHMLRNPYDYPKTQDATWAIESVTGPGLVVVDGQSVQFVYASCSVH